MGDVKKHSLVRSAIGDCKSVTSLRNSLTSKVAYQRRMFILLLQESMWVTTMYSSVIVISLPCTSDASLRHASPSHAMGVYDLQQHPKIPKGVAGVCQSDCLERQMLVCLCAIQSISSSSVPFIKRICSSSAPVRKLGLTSSQDALEAKSS